MKARLLAMAIARREVIRCAQSVAKTRVAADIQLNHRARPIPLGHVKRAAAACNRTRGARKTGDWVVRALVERLVELIERALGLDPKSVDAQSLLAESPVARVTNGLTGSAVADLLLAATLVDTVSSGVTAQWTCASC